MWLVFICHTTYVAWFIIRDLFVFYSDYFGLLIAGAQALEINDNFYGYNRFQA